MDPKHSQINYLYFGGFFVILLTIAASSIFTRESLGGSQFFFFLYALGQVVLEVALLIFMGLLIRRYLNHFFFALFIGGTFLLLPVHFFDFIMDRILDLSGWESLKVFVLDENLENFFYLLDASGVPLWLWFLIFASAGALPFMGYFIYKITDLAAQKKPLVLGHAHFLQAFLCIPCALFFWDFSASKVIHPDAHTAFIKSLPWKVTFFNPENVLISLPGPLSSLPKEAEIAAAIDQNNTALEKKPNIYLFVIESLREDCMTAEIAPHLNEFKKEHSHFDTALSNGNGTHISWFSIFHSQFPYCWNQAQKGWKMGSPALALLKKWGYQIRLYSSAQLGYYGMEEFLFGEDLHLLDSHQTFHHAPPRQAADSDAEAILKLQSDLAENPSLQQGQVFIIFWDCTHFGYSWPKNWIPKFNPYAKEIAYFKAYQSQKAIQSIKNRYRNSVNYLDTLFGSFFNNLPRKEEAIVVVTGDHGEEFFEHGHLFHNSHLTHEQTNIPLYFKFGDQSRKIVTRPLASQMDIFPSLLDFLSGEPVPFLEGNSLFQEVKWPFAVTARFNAGATPYEFSIHNGKNKLIAQFLNKHNIFMSKQLQILSLRTNDDRSIPDFKNHLDLWVRQEFGPALDRLFKKEED